VTSPQPANIEIGRELSERLTIHTNVDQEILVTTVDKVRICLMEHRDCLTARSEYVTPLSLVLTIFTTMAAASFRDFILPSAVWQAVYLIGGGLALYWLLRAAYRAWSNRKRGSIDALVGALKAHSTTPAVR